MAYNSINLLKKIIDIQDITLENTAVGVTQEYIYKTYIEPAHHISRATYYAYLNCNAKKELKQLQKTTKNG